jgi:adenylate cyclase
MADKQITRRLAAIFAADMVGYSRLMEADEEGTIKRQRAHRAALIDGRIVKTTGDGLLIEFASAVDAVECAVAVQRAMIDREAELPAERRITYRVGVNLGDLVIEGDDILGDGVNVAARLESLAMPEAVFVSGPVHEQVAGKVGVEFVDLGDRPVKNIGRLIHVWGWSPHGPGALGEWARTAMSGAAESEPSVAVLPFENRAGDADGLYLADGISEEVTTELSGYHWLKVIARSTSFAYRDEAEDTATLQRELGVRYVLRGNVRRHGSRVRVIAQLAEAATARQVWAQRYDAELDDLFDLQTEIAQSVAGAIQPELMSAEAQRVRGTLPQSVAAWDYAVRGRWQVLRIRRESNAEAKGYLEKALQLDPNCVAALAFLAYSHYVDVFFGWSAAPGESLQKASELALAAAALDDNDCWVQCALGLGAFLVKDPDGAAAHLRKAIAANPSFALGHGYLAVVLAFSGESEEAIEAAQRAISLSPKDPELFHFLVATGTANFVAGRYDVAADWARKVVAEQPTVPSGHRLLATSLGHLGRLDEARSALEHALAITPKLSETSIRNNIHFKNPGDLERYIAGMKVAGLPD